MGGTKQFTWICQLMNQPDLQTGHRRGPQLSPFPKDQCHLIQMALCVMEQTLLL